MYDDFRKAAVSATLNIFETMFFTFLELNDFPEGDASGQPGLTLEMSSAMVLRSEIPFSGNRNGVLRLFLPYDLSESLAMNFLGFEDEVTEAQILDMASELSNMICGNLFSLLDKTAVFILGSPLTEKLTSQEAMERPNEADITLNFQTEGQSVFLQLHLHPSS
jgi:hypothetical protein